MRLRVYGTEWRGSGPGCRLMLAGLGQLRAECRARGWSEPDLDAVAEALLDPRVALNGHLVYPASGRRSWVRAQGISTRSTATAAW